VRGLAERVGRRRQAVFPARDEVPRHGAARARGPETRCCG
jgi:hypothetical protein